MDYSKITLDELKKGYRYDKEHDIYICNYCAQNFEVGQIYSISNNFYTAEHAVSKHIEITHGSNLSQLISADTKYNTLTQNQKDLILLFPESVKLIVFICQSTIRLAKSKKCTLIMLNQSA